MKTLALILSASIIASGMTVSSPDDAPAASSGVEFPMGSSCGGSTADACTDAE